MDEPKLEPTAVETLLAHGQRNTAPVNPPDGFFGPPLFTLPKGWALTAAEEWEPIVPHRVRQSIHTPDLNSFVRYFRTFKGAASAIFANLDYDGRGSVMGVIDYHSPVSGPAWTSHVVTLYPVRSVEWGRWEAVNKKQMSQEEFAGHLENNLDTVADPDGADLLEMINTLTIEGGVSFRSAQRLTSGTISFAYANEQKAKSGNVEIPATFLLRMPVFDGGVRVELQARLRYRLNGAELKVWFELVNPHLAVRAAVDDIVEKLTVGTGVNPYLGKPC